MQIKVMPFYSFIIAYCAITTVYASVNECGMSWLERDRQMWDTNQMQKVKEQSMTNRDGFQMNITKFTDQLFPFISKFIIESKMDPMPIPVTQQSFWITTLFLVWSPVICPKLTYSLDRATLHHLSEFERRGPVILKYKDKTLDFDMNIAFDKILLSSHYNVSLFGFMQHRGHIFFKVSSILINIHMEVDVTNYKIALQRFKINDIGALKVLPGGHALTEELVISAINVALLFIKDALLDTINRHAISILEIYIKQINNIICSCDILRLLKYYWFTRHLSSVS